MREAMGKSTTMTTTSTTVALLAATAIAGLGFAYWSSESRSKGFETLIFEILRATSGKENEHESINGDDTNNSEKRKTEDLKKAFFTWLDRENKENRISRFRSSRIARNEQAALKDPRWMSDTIRSFLFSSRDATINPSLREDKSPILLLASPSSETEKAQNTFTDDNCLSPNTNTNDLSEETKNEKDFHRSFRTLQNTTEEMIKKEPIIREAFFTGVSVEEEIEQNDEQYRGLRRQSLSSSSSGSSWSSLLTTGSYEVNKENCLVEEEEEIERLLAYLRFVDLAKESSLSQAPKSHISRTTGFLRCRKKRIIPDTDGYEHLNFDTIEIQLGKRETQRAKVDYMAAINQHRKELVIALHYDESLGSSLCIDDRHKIKRVLTNSLILQHQKNSGVNIMEGPQSNSFLLLDEAVKKLHKEIFLRYLSTKMEIKNEKGEKLTFYSSGYSLVLCGHSLGAALACRLGHVIKHQDKNAILNPVQVRVYAFGPPPCLPSSHRLCENNMNHKNDYSFIVSVVNNHDCVPRWTESNLAGLQVSLQWTMDRKKHHFLQYHNRCNQYRPYTNTTVTPSSMRRPPQSQRIPPFTLTAGDWNTFWKSSQQRSNDTSARRATEKDNSKFIVPGKVVLMWNHSQDPTIIGAKVHVPGIKHSHPRSSNIDQLSHHQKNHDVLGRLWVEESMFSDHTIESYRSNLELLLGQVGNTI